jgi:hypothetical protein
MQPEFGCQRKDSTQRRKDAEGSRVAENMSFQPVTISFPNFSLRFHIFAPSRLCDFALSVFLGPWWFLSVDPADARVKFLSWNIRPVF